MTKIRLIVNLFYQSFIVHFKNYVSKIILRNEIINNMCTSMSVCSLSCEIHAASYILFFKYFFHI